MANKKQSSKAKSSKKKLADLEQTNGKVYEDQVSRARELEELLGIPKINPFKTNDKKVFQEMLQDMNLTDLQAFAVKVGVFPSFPSFRIPLTLAKKMFVFSGLILNIEGRFCANKEIKSSGSTAILR